MHSRIHLRFERNDRETYHVVFIKMHRAFRTIMEQKYDMHMNEINCISQS